MMQTEVFHTYLGADAEFDLIQILDRMGWDWGEKQDGTSIVITHPEEDTSMVEFICGEFM